MRKGKPRVGRRAFVPPPSCSIVLEASEVVWIPHATSFDLPDASKAVCNPHTVSFGFPDANKVACIPHTASFNLPARQCAHTVLFGLPDANEQCATHTPLSLSFYPPPSFGGDSSKERGGMKSHATSFELNYSPPTIGGILYQQPWGGVMDIMPPQFYFV